MPVDELAAIEGFDEDVAEELRRRARNFLEEETARLKQELADLGIADDLASVEGLNNAMLVALGREGIKTLEDFAGLVADEMTNREDGILREFKMDDETATDLIMQARVAVGWITQEDLDAMNAEEGEESEEEGGVEAPAGA